MSPQSPLMSGQSDGERRRIRHAQRALRQRMHEHEEEMEHAGNAVFDEMRANNNTLWNKVKYTREAVLDGENLDLIAARAARQVDRLVQVPRYDPSRMTHKLRLKCCSPKGSSGTPVFDWTMLGLQTGACFNAVPTQVMFLHGPLQADYIPKERVKRTKRVHSPDEEEKQVEQPENVKQMAKDPNQLSAVEQSMKDISKVLKRKCKETMQHHMDYLATLETDEERAREKKRIRKQGHHNVDAVPFLFNPHSFTETVENVFHFSFLVKSAAAKIKVLESDGQKKPVVSVIDVKEKNAAELPPAKQAIVSFSMQDFRRLRKAYFLKKGHLPHRSAGRKNKMARKDRDQLDQDEE